jgi:uncharacterized protein YbjQ (UPF0145 family)
VGFEPVGQVFGAAVFGTGYATSYRCPGSQASSRSPDDAGSAEAPERGSLAALAPLVQAMDGARQTAMERMAAECAALGGDGVVGLRLARGPFLLGGHEFSVLGTAVRARGAAGGTAGRAAREERAPFTSGLSGQDFAKLISQGWVPAGFVLSIAMGARHDDWQTARQTRRWRGNAEVAGWTQLVSESRREARRQLEGDVRRLGAEGVVVAGMDMRVRVRDCPAQVGRRDHIVEATLFGTAVARFSRAGDEADGPPAAVMRLGG